MSLNREIVKSDNLIIELRDYILGVMYSLQKLNLGRTLTVIDGCIADPEQRKAIKDLIKDKYWQEESWTNEVANILWKFDEVSKLGLIKDDSIYRTLFGLPTELGTTKQEVPANQYFN